MSSKEKRKKREARQPIPAYYPFQPYITLPPHIYHPVEISQLPLRWGIPPETLYAIWYWRQWQKQRRASIRIGKLVSKIKKEMEKKTEAILQLIFNTKVF
jgi:hypothetical protein